MIDQLPDMEHEMSERTRHLLESPWALLAFAAASAAAVTALMLQLM
ncbi:MAG: hypothetical protein JNK82_28745 [Myxococcaceae bacterium]|nr:hypothetical protein [Myxococcaceae bacterium]